MKKMLLLLVALVAVVGIIYCSGMCDYVSLASIKREAHNLKMLTEHHYIIALSIYFMTYVGMVMIGLPVIGPLSLLGGFLFGLLPGIILSLLGVLCGSLLYFMLVRYFFLAYFEHAYAARLAKFKAHIHEYGYSYLLILHFVTVVPFFVINTLAAIAGIPLWHVAWTTVVGSFPLLFVYVFAGRQLYYINSVRDIFSPQVLLVLALLIVVVLGSIAVRKTKVNGL